VSNDFGKSKKRNADKGPLSVHGVVFDIFVLERDASSTPAVILFIAALRHRDAMPAADVHSLPAIPRNNTEFLLHSVAIKACQLKGTHRSSGSDSAGFNGLLQEMKR
jgi:hypothetical protein